MKKIIPYLFISVIIFVIQCLLFAFGYWELNPKAWGNEARFIFAAIYCMVTFPSIVAFFAYQSKAISVKEFIEARKKRQL